MENVIVKLNVGGTIYHTTKDTLRESEYLSNLVEGNWLEKLLRQREIFIDRDGFLFRYVLLYLRTGEVDIDKQYWKSLRNEAEFYLIPKLSSMISKLLSKEEIVFMLLDQQEFLNFSGIDISSNAGSLTNGMAVGFEKKFITSIQCDVTSYNCPRGIFVHKEPKSCGKVCNRAKGYGYVKYSSKKTIMYLVSTAK
ncbi:BTB/POZ protein [Thamnidium elegans]|nr:BTB/POZ protein [Thamnidium elegans]